MRHNDPASRSLEFESNSHREPFSDDEAKLLANILRNVNFNFSYLSNEEEMELCATVVARFMMNGYITKDREVNVSYGQIKSGRHCLIGKVAEESRENKYKAARLRTDKKSLVKVSAEEGIPPLDLLQAYCLKVLNVDYGTAKDVVAIVVQGNFEDEAKIDQLKTLRLPKVNNALLMEFVQCGHADKTSNNTYVMDLKKKGATEKENIIEKVLLDPKKISYQTEDQLREMKKRLKNCSRTPDFVFPYNVNYKGRQTRVLEVKNFFGSLQCLSESRLRDLRNQIVESSQQFGHMVVVFLAGFEHSLRFACADEERAGFYDHCDVEFVDGSFLNALPSYYLDSPSEDNEGHTIRRTFRGEHLMSTEVIEEVTSDSKNPSRAVFVKPQYAETRFNLAKIMFEYLGLSSSKERKNVRESQTQYETKKILSMMKAIDNAQF